MESTVKERLITFIEHRGLTKNKFETMCGLSKRYVSNISQSISPAVCKKISLTFPELNMAWVLTGQGEMLNTMTKPTEPVIISGDLMRLSLNQSDTILSQQETIRELVATIARMGGGIIRS